MFVIPAKAGIQFVKCSSKKRKNFLDPGLRRDDETKENEFQLPFLGSRTQETIRENGHDNSDESFDRRNHETLRENIYPVRSFSFTRPG